MSEYPPCPKCGSVYTYQDQLMLVCPECAHEWPIDASAQQSGDESSGDDSSGHKTDAFGTPLVDGDAVTVIKDLKIKGSSSVVKQGTKVKNIRIVDGVNGHDIDCKIPGFGSMQLKSEFVKKL